MAMQPIPNQEDPSRSDGPERGGGWLGALAVIALSMALAVALLGIDWHRMLVQGDVALPENQRSMVVTPMPR